MKKLILLLLLLPAASQAYGPYDAVVTKNIDGDSLVVMIDIYPGIYREVELRAPGVNTAELHPRFGCSTKADPTACHALEQCEKTAAQKAAAYTASLFPVGSHVHVDNLNPNKTKYYGRMNADVTKGDVRWSTALLQSGNGRPYNGGKRVPWCQSGPNI